MNPAQEAPLSSTKSKKKKMSKKTSKLEHVPYRGPTKSDIAVENVLEMVRQRDLNGATNLFLTNTHDAHGAHGQLLEALVRMGRLSPALQVVRQAKATGPL